MLLGGTRDLIPSIGEGFSRATRPGVTAPDDNTIALLIRDWGVPTFDRLERVAWNISDGSWVAVSGNPLFPREPGETAAPRDAGARTLQALHSGGLRALEHVDGAFGIVWWCASQQKLYLIRDRFGSEPLFYSHSRGGIVFGSRIRDLVAAGLIRATLSAQGLAEYLVFCYVPGTRTLHEGVQRVPAGSAVVYSPTSGTMQVERWYTLSFANPMPADEDAIAGEYRTLLEAAVTRRLGPTDPGALLSGGMDSSSAVTFARHHWSGPIQSFGFRCAGASFDESVYARGLAKALGVEHHEVEYGPEQPLSLTAAAAHMDVPFCDAGIEIGTWLLGQAAQSKIEYVITGDGGDEIWASHPVYAAQKLMRWYDAMHMPRIVNDGLWHLASLVHDSDQKRNLPVVIKRLLPMPGIPRDLQHFRWRAYFATQQLSELLTPEWARKVQDVDPFESVRRSFEGYTGPDDGISPMLYSDYTTASSFYFSRLLLLRRFGIEPRTPYYDRKLVEFGARIPAHLKLEGMERTKRLFKQSMKGVLPEVVNGRKDKIGHSVPFKNWLREKSPVSIKLQTELAPEKLEKRGVFRVGAISRMMKEHRARLHNHSHRLWAVFLLQQWLGVFFE
jgi:asparagine synthase (glutamine-hydrolysing)